jgi:hypothetical protein
MSIEMKGFIVHIDSENEWIEVSLEDLADVGISPSDLSEDTVREIAMDQVRIFLSEEQDADLFLEKYDKKYGEKVPMMYTTMNYEGRCFIRNLRSIRKADA